MTGSIPLTMVVDNSQGGRVRSARHGHRDRSIYLRFQQLPDDGGYRVFALGDALRPHLQFVGLAEAELRLDQATLHQAIVEVQDEWRAQVVGRRETRPVGGDWFPFADSVRLFDDAAHSQRLHEVMPRLARAGLKLFEILFHSGDQLLVDIGDALRSALRVPGQVITVVSDTVFVPWWLLYTPVDDDLDLDADDVPHVPPEGFWGYAHTVEHDFIRSPTVEPCIRTGNGGLTAGVNVDRNLDEEFPEAQCVGPMIEVFERTVVRTIVRDTKLHLGRDIKSRHYADSIMYFGCHGIGVSETIAPSGLRLTDGEAIATTDFKQWLKQSPLSTNPLVFINACQGGQMSSLFYRSIGSELVARGANSLIGPQIDVPPLFAREYGRAFVQNLVRPGARVGDIFHDLARWFFDTGGNPLGLVMSLYRGIDTHVCQE
jgi:hypothetical protein